jgi:hypothetical protein
MFEQIAVGIVTCDVLDNKTVKCEPARPYPAVQ